MTEHYNLPILFTEEERQRYAAWGIKKEKTLLPFGIIAAIIEVLGVTALVIYLLGVRSREPYFSTFLSTWGNVIGSVSYWVTLAAMILVLKPLALLFDLIFKKPADPKMLHLNHGRMVWFIIFPARKKFFNRENFPGRNGNRQ